MPDATKPKAIDPNRPWFSFQAATEGKKRKSKVCIYDAIGGWFGIQTSDFVKELNDLDVDEIELHLNSPGGSAFDGIAIYNALRQHQAKVTVIVDGLAASAASAVAMSGDEIIMCRGSSMMIHDASAIAWGNAATCRKTADVLDKLSNNYAKIYAAQAGGTKEDWRAEMLAETWYDADEAVAAGLAHRTDETAADADAMAAFDLSMFVYAGRENAPAPTEKREPVKAAALGLGFPPPGDTADWAAHLTRAATTSVAAVSVTVHPTKTPVSSEPGEKGNRKEGTPMEEFLTNLRTRLGLTAEATTEDILAALDTERTKAPTLPEGVVAIEQTKLDSLQADAADGRDARKQQTTERRDGIVAAALREGRFGAKTGEAIRAQMETDEPGAVALIATFAKDSVPVTEIGNSTEDSAEDSLYDKAWPTAGQKGA